MKLGVNTSKQCFGPFRLLIVLISWLHRDRGLHYLCKDCGFYLSSVLLLYEYKMLMTKKHKITILLQSNQFNANNTFYTLGSVVL